MVTQALAAGREAFARREWTRAFATLSTAETAGAALGAEDLERLAISAYLIGKDEVSAGLWARAHSEYVRAGAPCRAARCSFWLVLDLLSRAELARASGWHARAQRLLDDHRCDCAERGLLLVLAARRHLKAGALGAAHDAASQAVEIAHRFDDADVRVFSRLILAQTSARRGDAAGAAALFDEIMVAVTIGDASSIAVGTIYCAVIDGCYALFDLRRAREWTSDLSRWCSTQPDLVAFRGQCVVHRTEVLRLSGAWSQAKAEAEQGCSWLMKSLGELAEPSDAVLAFKYPVGPAFYQLAEMHRLCGEFAKAEAAYRQASQFGYSPEPGLALLRLAQGRPRVAEATIRRLLGETQNKVTRVEVLAACVDVMLAVSDLTTARLAAEELATMAADAGAAYLRTLSAHVTGSILLAGGDALGALASLRQAWIGWQEIGAPWNAARTRVLLGLTCRAVGDEDGAALEFEAAQRIFARLAAAPDVARVTALCGLPTAAARMLTQRERQILGLVAAGKRNRAIAEELAISERTVDRHVGNILSKLDLPSRSAATAYAYEQGLV